MYFHICDLLQIFAGLGYKFEIREIKNTTVLLAKPEMLPFTKKRELQGRDWIHYRLYGNMRFMNTRITGHKNYDHCPLYGMLFGKNHKGIYISKVYDKKLIYLVIPYEELDFGVKKNSANNSLSLFSYGKIQGGFIIFDQNEKFRVVLKVNDRFFELDILLCEDEAEDEISNNQIFRKTNLFSNEENNNQSGINSNNEIFDRGDQCVPANYQLTTCNHCASEKIKFSKKAIDKRRKENGLSKKIYIYLCLECSRSFNKNERKQVNKFKSARLKEKSDRTFIETCQSAMPTCRKDSCLRQKLKYTGFQLGRKGKYKDRYTFICLNCSKSYYYESLEEARYAANCCTKKDDQDVVFSLDHLQQKKDLINSNNDFSNNIEVDSLEDNLIYNYFCSDKLSFNCTPNEIQLTEVKSGLQCVLEKPYFNEDSIKHKVLEVNFEKKALVGLVTRKWKYKSVPKEREAVRLFVIYFNTYENDLIAKYIEFDYSELGLDEDDSITKVSVEKCTPYTKKIGFSSQKFSTKRSITLYIESKYYNNSKKTIENLTVVRTPGRQFYLSESFIKERIYYGDVPENKVLKACVHCKKPPVLFNTKKTGKYYYYCIPCDRTMCKGSKPNAACRSNRAKRQELAKTKYGVEIPACSEDHCPAKGSNYAVRCEFKRKLVNSGTYNFKCFICNVKTTYKKDKSKKRKNDSSVVISLKRKKK